MTIINAHFPCDFLRHCFALDDSAIALDTIALIYRDRPKTIKETGLPLSIGAATATDPRNPHHLIFILGVIILGVIWLPLLPRVFFAAGDRESSQPHPDPPPEFPGPLTAAHPERFAGQRLTALKSQPPQTL
jgi:hypothetical protein